MFSFLLSHALETARHQPKGASSLNTLRQASKSLAQQVAVLAPLIVGRETGGVRRLGDLALEDLLEGVGALARGRVDVAHQMHLGGCEVCIERLVRRCGGGSLQLVWCAEGDGRRWWWCCFRNGKVSCCLVQIFEKLRGLVGPGSELVLLLAPRLIGQ